ncbi:response regulator [Zhongshania aliphaticivorans]|uniref:Sensory/regulatory protein RpfC n=1 Tax=Zhongshania aliphaticivorans TaxID=1470434 RepID=A0A127M304_9GAMM|nr:response regulator [Zhongshania aliphaticivorans]AMO67615.1 hypothetical protein AZF00_04585 [Zhongshania aliphaticivorans]
MIEALKIIITTFKMRFLSFVLLLFVVLTVLMIPVSDRNVRIKEERQLENHLRNAVDERSKAFMASIERLKRDTLFLAGTPPIQGIIRAKNNGGIDPQVNNATEVWEQRLQEIFSAYLEIQPGVQQVRYIGVADQGRELVRVDRKGQKIAVIGAAQLQQKADRDYFFESLNRALGEVYVSKIDLNREFGEIEIPHIPTLRLATPVFDKAGSAFGVLVINVNLLDIFATIGADFSSDENVYLVNSDGDFLMHPEAGRAFGFELGAPFRWQDEFDRTFSSKENKLYRVSDGALFYIAARENYYDGDHSLGVAVLAPESVVDQTVAAARTYNLIILVSLLFITLVFLYLMAINIRRREEPARQNSSMAAIVEGSNDAIVSETVDGVIHSWNDAAQRMFGYATEQVVGKTMNSLVVPEDLEDEAVMLRKRVFNGETIPNFETRRRDQDGDVIYVSITVSPVKDANGRIFAAANIIRDISDMKAAQAQLVEMNHRLEEQVAARTSELEASGVLQDAILANAGYAIFANKPDGTITLFNPAAEAMLGYSASEMVNKRTMQVMFIKEEIEAELKRLAQLDHKTLVDSNGKLITQDVNYEKEWTFIRKDGTRIPVLLKSNTLYDKENKVSGYIGIARDLTLQKQQQAELMKAKAMAEEASKTKGEFLANMSHEIRTPMNAVLGMLNLLKYTDMTNRQLDYVSKASGAAEALLGIINDILDFSKIEAGKLLLEKRPFSIDEILKDIAVILSMNISDKNVEILFNIDPAVPKTVLGDSLRIKQILINLAGNAVKFTEQGEVMLSVFVQHERSNSMVLGFKVSDTGIGMSADQQKRVFESFTQAEAATTRRFGGTGLGLVICQRLIRLMGGELEVESEEGKGSTFSFSLIIEPVEDGALREPARRALPVEYENLRLLVLDDNAHAREIIAGICQNLGWEVEEAESGNIGLELIKRSLLEAKPYDIVFIDWMMPGLDGWQTASAIQALCADTLTPRLVMVTGHAKEVFEQQEDAISTALDGFLMKPVTASDIYNTIIEALADKSAEYKTGIQQSKATNDGLVGMRILLVEDNITNQQVARELLAIEGAEIVVADNGQIALDSIRHAKLPFDAVLMDIQMPVMDGYTATREIRETLKLNYLPIVAMTANAMPADRAACLAAGMNDHIGKPFDLAELVTVLQTVCGRAKSNPQVDAVSKSEGRGDLPEAPVGFAFKEALLRLGNNRELYASQARMFASRHRDDLGKVLLLIQKGNRPGAVRELHTLRGVAGTLGAQALASRLSELEMAAKGLVEVPVIETLLNATEVHLEEACEVMLKLADSLAAPSRDVTPPPLIDEEINAKLDEFGRLLKDSNMSALDSFESLRAIFAVDSEPAIKVREAMASLDFAAALEALNMMRDN